VAETLNHYLHVVGCPIGSVAGDAITSSWSSCSYMLTTSDNVPVTVLWDVIDSPIVSLPSRRELIREELTSVEWSSR
jgi:hypothetical protein